MESESLVEGSEGVGHGSVRVVVDSRVVVGFLSEGSDEFGVGEKVEEGPRECLGSRVTLESNIIVSQVRDDKKTVQYSPQR